MSSEKEDEKTLLPHHEQLPLCTTRLPYRQGRKLTAVKVYTVNNESAHLLILGVPSLNLRREAKDLFIKFGKLTEFNIMKDHAVEDFTETYHAFYDTIQSARIAKKMLDTNNFYGGSLHICYAPELETIEETRHKLYQRKKDVLFRLRNLQKESLEPKSREHFSEIEVNLNKNETNFNSQAPIGHKNVIGPILNALPFERTEIINEIEPICDDQLKTPDNSNTNDKKLNMGDSNVIYLNRNKKKRSKRDTATDKIYKSNFKKSKLSNQYGPSLNNDISTCFERPTASSGQRNSVNNDRKISNEEILFKNDTDIVDCTSTDIEVVSNINEALNYNKFGNEIVRKVEAKPLNKIVFNINKKIL